MRYKNTRTGIEFESNCIIRGENIEVIDEKPAEVNAEPVEKVKDEPKPKKRGQKK